MTHIACWREGEFVCGIMADGELKPVYELWLQHGEDLIRSKTYSTMDAAVEASKLWQRQMAVARTAAMNRSTPFDSGSADSQ